MGNKVISMQINQQCREIISRSITEHMADEEITDAQIFAVVIGLHSVKSGIIESLAITYKDNKEILNALRRVVSRLKEIEDSDYKKLASLF